MMGDLAFLFVGLAAGALHFTLLRWNATLYLRGGVAGALAVQMLRLGALAAVLVVVARHGAWPLLLVALGTLLARPCVMRLTAPLS